MVFSLFIIPLTPNVINLIVILSVLFFCGKLYSAINNQKPSQLLDLADINDTIRKLSGVWLFLIPIVSLMSVFYNIGVTVVWFSLNIINWVVKGLKWIWNEVIIAGGFLLLKVLYHYLLIWPWNIFKLAFESIRPAANLANYKVAVYALFLSFFISFFGKFLVNNFHLSNYYETIFTLLSILPIGIAISSIINSLNGNSEKKVEHRNKYIKHASILIILFCALYLVEGIIINIGSSNFIFSTIMVGGNLFASAFIILNAALLIFILSALPSFSINYDGDNKGLIKAFGSYLLHKWPQYLLALPAIIIPAILVSILPYFLTKGLSVVSQSFSNSNYEKKINVLQAVVDSSKTAKYESWSKVDSLSKLTISDDSLSKLITIDNSSLDNITQLTELRINQQYLQEYYSKFSDSIGATPFLLLNKGYSKYKKFNNQWINSIALDSTKYKSKDTTSIVDSREKNAGDTTRFINDMLQNNTDIAKADSLLITLTEELNAVCLEPSLSVKSPPLEEIKKETNEPELKKEEVDKCLMERNAINAKIDANRANKSQLLNTLALNKLKLERSKKIVNHLNSKIKCINDAFLSQKSAIKWSYLFVSIWLCLLLALAFGLALSLFAHLNHAIYNISSPDNKWMVLSEIEKAKSINPNQPLLGLTLLTILILFYKPIMNFFPTNYKTIIDVVSLKGGPKNILDKSYNNIDTARNNLFIDSKKQWNKIDSILQNKNGYSLKNITFLNYLLGEDKIQDQNTDQDKDGILDKEDECPTEYGIQELNGCPEVVLKEEEQQIIDFATSRLEFATADTTLTENSTPGLDDLADLMIKHSDWTLKMDGHTDNQGKAADNLKLSEGRVLAVKRYLTDKGVPENQIITEFFGQTKPIESNKTEEGRKKNRRVEMNVKINKK